MTKGWNWATLPLNTPAEQVPIPIAWDAVVATQALAGGRMIPLVILDTTSRPDIDDMVRAHRLIGPGDVESVWSKVSRWDDSRVQLILMISKPSRCVVVLEFDVVKQGGLVDYIVQAQGLYLQPGRPGDRLISTVDTDRILVEVPSKDFRDEWEKMFLKGLLRKFRADGCGRQLAKERSRAFLREWRKLGSTRLPDA